MYSAKPSGVICLAVASSEPISRNLSAVGPPASPPAIAFCNSAMIGAGVPVGALAIIRRHAAAHLNLPRAGARPEDRADGRAVWRTRCHDARTHECRTPTHPARDPEDHLANHPFDPGGRFSRGPRDGDVPTAR